jgi:sulfoxide reductase heme-binding subunit YedZ
MSRSSAVDRVLRTRVFYWTAFAACLLPGLVFAWRFVQAATGAAADALGPDPVKETLHTTGRYALTLLLVALSVTPARRLFGLNGLQKARRMFGLWSFTYAVLHVTTYLVFDQLCYSPRTCQWHDIWVDFTKREFTFVGLLAFSILLVLALTSTNGWIRRLGKRWQTIHRLVYVAAVAAVVHFIWGQKSDIRLPLEYAGVLALLFGARLYLSWQKRQGSGPAARAGLTP